MTGRDEYYMRLALKEAETALNKGEVPVGAILVLDNRVIAATHNTKESKTDPTAHAELLALREGALLLGDWRLTHAALYVTKEPCVMCAGAMVNARLGRLVFGCKDSKYGAVTSRFQITSDTILNHQVPSVSGVLENECSDILRTFFEKLRACPPRNPADKPA
jgi:tRNA(adenine34) deaminase